MFQSIKDWWKHWADGTPHFVIGRPNEPYMLRWWVIPRNRLFNVYLHRIVHDDEDRAFHDHPWISLSVVLKNGYSETTAAGTKFYPPGSFIFRRSTHAHMLKLVDGKPATTLFITGPVIREWGFLCKKRWVHWKEFVEPTNHGQVGKGCGEH